MARDSWWKIGGLSLLGFAGMRKEDVLLSSFPRSGSTWLRFILCNLISLQEWDARTVDFPLLNRTMVELGANNLLQSWPHMTLPRVVKTHWKYLPIFGRNRSIGIIRDPRDVMVSQYHFLKDRLGVFGGSFSELVRSRRHGLESWFRHYLSWRDHWSLVVRYEAIRAITTEQVARVLGFLGWHGSTEIVEEAIRRSGIDAVRGVYDPDLSAGGDEARFARSGEVQQWSEYFSPSDISHYQKLAKSYGLEDYAGSAGSVNEFPAGGE